MIIGIPKEIMHDEARVAATPETVGKFVQQGFEVLVERHAGDGALYHDEDYVKAGAKIVLGMDDLMTEPVDGSGCNPQFGLLGSNKATDETVKLFPVNCTAVAEGIAAKLSAATGVRFEAMVYSALAQQLISTSKAASLLGVSINNIRKNAATL